LHEHSLYETVGRDIFHALQAGASAVQMGTAFLPCAESGASAAHKRYILHEPVRDTVLTTAFSGRPARGIRNAFIDTMGPQPRVLPFPLQNSLTAGLRARAVKDDDGEKQSLWVGVSYAQARQRCTPSVQASASEAKSGTTSGNESDAAPKVHSGKYPNVAELMNQLHDEFHKCSNANEAAVVSSCY
jgi:NAD(P)H-dependent flavin oxidoreductase YrpB (nitropropane dioxygenase family)